MTATLLHSGKVRDVFDAGDGLVVLVASDRVSAYDVVMAEPIPGKGRMLTELSAFWFRLLAEVVPSHFITTDVEGHGLEGWDGRATLARRAEMLPLECIVRGYLAGSAWVEYARSGTVHGQPMPVGLREAERLPEPVFTPSTKAAAGDHDENLSYDEAAALVDPALLERVRDASVELYRRGAEHAADRGILVADTKFEFGLVEGELVVADEVLTPDSSRFWPAGSWQPGTTPPSLDKQPLRDHLAGLDWDRTPPPPSLPDEVVEATSRRYAEAFHRLTARP